MKSHAKIFCLLVLFYSFNALSETLIWSDDFTGTAINPLHWTFLIGPRDNATLTPDAAQVSDGILRIRTSTQNSTHSTAFLMSKNLFETRYGYFEARIRFHDSPGSWCAFWLQSNTIGNPLGQPAIAGVEADIVEHRAVDENNRDISNTAVMNLHWDGYTNHHKRVGSTYHPSPNAASMQDNWHVYGLRWTPEKYIFYLDDVQQWDSSTDPNSVVSQHEQHIRLTCEVRDHSWAGNIPTTGYGSALTSQTGMDVDWVRVWQ